jgi:ATP adenylyltransferase
VDILWAGWRSDYVTSPEAQSDDAPCLFCRLPSEPDDDALILERGEAAFSVMNRFPYTNGHFMVSQYRHVAAPGDLSEEERLDVWRLLVRAHRVVTDVMEPDGFNIGVNLGRAAGAGVPGHLHVHGLPRWQGDTNFMTAVASVRVIPESLEVTWRRLREGLGGG